jgi:hypothetical protein
VQTSWKSYFDFDILDLLLIGDQLACSTGTISNNGFTPGCYNNSGRLSINTKASILSYSLYIKISVYVIYKTLSNFLWMSKKNE